MIEPASPLVAVGTVLLALAAGVYVVALLDEALARVVAGVPLEPGRVVALPLQRAARHLVAGATTTERPDAPAWTLGVASLGALAAGAVVVVPLSPTAAVADVDDGIVLFGAAMALVMVAVFLHGWSANSPMALVGGYRFVAQALSYEMPIALVLIAAALPAESLGVGAIVTSQRGLWNVVRQPLGLPIYLIATTGLAFWGPLATADGADLAGGTRVEASGSHLLAWKAARAAVLVAACAVGASVFLGGWWGPVLPGPVWVVAKTVLLLTVVVAGGHLLARVRLERFVVVAWAVLIPLALVDVFASGVLALR